MRKRYLQQLGTHTYYHHYCHRLRSTWRYECFETFDWSIRR